MPIWVRLVQWAEVGLEEPERSIESLGFNNKMGIQWRYNRIYHQQNVSKNVGYPMLPQITVVDWIAKMTLHRPMDSMVQYFQKKHVRIMYIITYTQTCTDPYIYIYIHIYDIHIYIQIHIYIYVHIHNIYVYIYMWHGGRICPYLIPLSLGHTLKVNVTSVMHILSIYIHVHVYIIW